MRGKAEESVVESESNRNAIPLSSHRQYAQQAHGSLSQPMFRRIV
jgi:hypothetical protein